MEGRKGGGEGEQSSKREKQMKEGGSYGGEGRSGWIAGKCSAVYFCVTADGLIFFFFDREPNNAGRTFLKQVSRV